MKLDKVISQFIINEQTIDYVKEYLCFTLFMHSIIMAHMLKKYAMIYQHVSTEN